MGHIKTTNILEFDSFEQIPDPFLWIEFWRISRQTFKMNPLGATFPLKTGYERQKILPSWPEQGIQWLSEVTAFRRELSALSAAQRRYCLDVRAVEPAAVGSALCSH